MIFLPGSLPAAVRFQFRWAVYSQLLFAASLIGAYAYLGDAAREPINFVTLMVFLGIANSGVGAQLALARSIATHIDELRLKHDELNLRVRELEVRG